MATRKTREGGSEVLVRPGGGLPRRGPMMPNRRAGRPRAVLAKATRRAAAASRRALGPLHLLKATPRTATVYTKHLAIFFEWMKAEGITIPSRTEYFDDMSPSSFNTAGKRANLAASSVTSCPACSGRAQGSRAR
jgi:hypothetical protein